ncbi:site-specific integrase [Mucilaginibacter sp. ZT4R22]|uniref:Site-specific integrase n=1 Tax=Mucilaginibacter pankratovii TaxID=2772110 RepID=A0ABR7WQ42_9SPHI|nr:site-specific integrase [Mucilaginibacter pankratovii]MBD1364448.1 site-specific integrase [Mucilaginibacter pankratovii]
MVTYKLALDERRAKQDGTFPLVVRVTFNRKVNAYQTGIYLKTEHWDKFALQVTKANTNALALSSKATEEYLKIQKAILKVESEGEFTFDALKDILYPTQVKKMKEKSFKEFANDVMNDMKKVMRTGGAYVYQTAVNRLIDYCDDEAITFSKIDYTFLEKFKNSLYQQGLKENSVGNYFRTIRALYNKAIKAKIVSRELYPFNDIPIKTEKTAKRAIKADEVSKLYDYPKKTNSQEWHAANYLFLSFTLRGISFTDLAYLKPGNIKDGCVVYRRRKTKKLYNIRLHPVALNILKLYENGENGYLLPVFPKGMIEDGEESKKITRQWIKTTNKYLNRIAEQSKVGGNITTYVIRHTWATIAKRLGYSNELIAEGMGHEYGNKITNIYLDEFDQTLIEDMNDRVITSVIPCPKRVVYQGKYVLKEPNRISLHINLSSIKFHCTR